MVKPSNLRLSPRLLAWSAALLLAAPRFAVAGEGGLPLAETAGALAALDRVIQANTNALGAFHQRGVLHFQRGELAAAVADFDRVIALDPARAPEYWQRGIALYYLGRYADGRRQFERHQTVNPDDVENAAWHFLCVAKQENPAAARKVLMAIHGDGRVPMMKILELFAGKATAADVLAEAARGNPGPAELRGRLFYAHLYLGLFAAANGDAPGEREHLRLAVTDYAGDHYMADVARVHWALLPPPPAAKP